MSAPDGTRFRFKTTLFHRRSSSEEGKVEWLYQWVPEQASGVLAFWFAPEGGQGYRVKVHASQDFMVNRILPKVPAQE